MWWVPGPACGVLAPAGAEAPGRRGSVVAGRVAPASGYASARHGRSVALPDSGRVRGHRRRRRMALRISPPALAFSAAHRNLPDPLPPHRAGPAGVREGGGRARPEGPTEPAVDSGAEQA